MTRPDVLVVGAGIVGAAVAWELAREGLSVLVLDSRPPGGMTTAAGMGHIVVMDDSDAQFALTRLSQRLWGELRPELPASVEWLACGTIWVAADDDELAAARRKEAYYRERGVAAELLDGQALREAEPALHPGLAGGLRMPGDSVIYPPAAVDWLLARAVAAGASVRRAVARRIGDGVVACEDGVRLEAGFVVNAAGNDALALMEVPPPGLDIRPRKGHLVITERYPDYCRHQLVELGYLKSAHGHAASSVAFNLQPRATGQLLLGSSRQYDRTDDAVEGEVVARMVARAREFLPDVGALRAIRAWTGFRGATADQLPIVGPAPSAPRTLVAAGHEGLGITTSTGTARLLADHILGRSPEIDPLPYAAIRGSAA